MQVSNQKLFSDQLDEVIYHFPQLKKVVGSDDDFLKGILDIPNDEGEVIGSFMIEIKNHEEFPYRFPILYETAGDIRNEADWHKYPDHSCCITVEPDERLICRNGITVLEFIERHVIAYFANHHHRLITGQYKNGEYAHGLPGIRQFYADLFKTPDMGKWIEYYKHVFHEKSIDIGRNDQCFCGSGKKYKFCHDKVFQDLKWLGENKVKRQLLLIMK